MGHRFKHTGDFVPGSVCEMCGAGLDHPEHDTTREQEAAEDAAEKVKAAHEILQAERDVAVSRVRELLGALGSDGNAILWSNVLSDEALAQALDKITSLRNHATCADETLTRVRGEHDLAKTRVAALRTELDLAKTRVRVEVDSQCRKNDEAYIEIESLRRLLNERQEAAVVETTTYEALSEHEAMVLRLIQQYKVIGTDGVLDKAKAVLALGSLDGRPGPFATAASWLAEQRKLVGDEWCEPLHNVNPDDGDVFEWWGGSRKLTVYFKNGVATFLQIWDAEGDPVPAMSEGVVDNIAGLYQWLQEGVQTSAPSNEAKSATPTAFTLSTGRLLERAALSPSGKKIVDECFRLAEMLIEKNIAYGDSALNPLRVFAKDIDTRAQILVRLDDKLSRLARGSAAGEDVILDLLGYLILYRIAPATAPAEKPAVDPVKAALKGISAREPTPEEVAMLRQVATESEENSPYQERRFVECPMCRAKPGSPLLCDDCLKRRSAAWIP
jgi:hypothetical protein